MQDTADVYKGMQDIGDVYKGTQDRGDVYKGMQDIGDVYKGMQDKRMFTSGKTSTDFLCNSFPEAKWNLKLTADYAKTTRCPKIILQRICQIPLTFQIEWLYMVNELVSDWPSD